MIAARPEDNLVIVQRQDGKQVTYDPSRLRGISAHQEIQLEIANGEGANCL